MKLVRLALREPKDGALEAREAKFIYVALAPVLCRIGVGMKQFLECCAGIDIGKREMTVTILTGSVEVEPIPQMGTFGTTVQELNRCLEWLLGNHCSRVVVESTGTYWVPVWNVLHERVAVIVATLSRVCICSPCYQPWALTASMLADTSLPHGSDVDLSIVGTLSERFRQVVAFPL
jgi:hypothetical protein